MVMVKIGGEEQYLDEYMRANLDELRKAVALNWDGVLLYGGYEGDGKTTCCAQHMAYLDPAFSLSRVCFNLDQLSALMDTLPPGSALMYDESWKDISNTSRFSNEQKRLIKILTEKRKRRLYIGIVAATFFDLNKYFVIHRTRAYIHIYAKGLERGFFRFFNRDRKLKLMILGRRDWNLDIVKPNFKGRFGKWLPFDAEEYDVKKEAYTRASEKEDTEEAKDKNTTKACETTRKETVGRLLNFLNVNRWLKPGANPQIARFLNVDVSTLDNWRQNFDESRVKPKKSRFLADVGLITDLDLNGESHNAEREETTPKSFKQSLKDSREVLDGS